ncbi:MAG: hypothetical protein SPK23_05140 [Eubacteriales bacterium]|nr:hypothetical protein [Eubacteriales bacterium]
MGQAPAKAPAGGLEIGKEIVPDPVGAGNAIYLDGETGDDNKTGESPEQAVMTFDKAKELAAANPAIDTIFVTGRVLLDTSDISLSGTKAILKRGPNYLGCLLLIKPDAEVNLTNITIDGGALDSAPAEDCLIDCRGTLNILDGAILQNNNPTEYPGGAVFGKRAIISMKGGIIKNNYAPRGGGIYLETNSVLHMIGGSINDNSCDDFGGGYIFYKLYRSNVWWNSFR